MKYFFPDSQDFVDPLFDFETEKHQSLRVTQRDDVYAHHLLAKPYDGLLISKAIVDGLPGKTDKTRYSRGQRYRLYREGAHQFFRLSQHYEVMGDSGAFSYIQEDTPPYSTDDLINFYVKTRVDSGVSLDHVVVGYNDTNNELLLEVKAKHLARVELSLNNAEEFLGQQRNYSFTPYGVAQGWDKASYIESVSALKSMGYKHITIGGIVTLDSMQICDLLDQIHEKVPGDYGIHLLGIGRQDILPHLASRNVISVDSTTPLKQSFLSEKHNFRLNGDTYCAIRLPQSFGNTRVKNAISSGQISQENVSQLERNALQAVRLYGQYQLGVEATLNAIQAYEKLVFNREGSLNDEYSRTLIARPWEQCGCNICKAIGIEVLVFRGTERNKRRAFHNLQDFYKNLMVGNL
ncbi:tRNA-guanine transglycosylase [Vibrio lentus]|uniref:tRNA-guanine transglycosylase DpdA n=1 Tax=Vibrio lentus TaxID=136468 RepID=UPI0010BD2903|nr:tRNA-guanine transglycosylase DpdA [Vibrio lentus]TKF96044.1 tRNA-guanine transglycosylase [Vibrio lentus]